MDIRRRVHAQSNFPEPARAHAHGNVHGCDRMRPGCVRIVGTHMKLPFVLLLATRAGFAENLSLRAQGVLQHLGRSPTGAAGEAQGSRDYVHERCRRCRFQRSAARTGLNPEIGPFYVEGAEPGDSLVWRSRRKDTRIQGAVQRSGIYGAT